MLNENPLFLYKEAEGLSWRQLEEITDVPFATLRVLSSSNAWGLQNTKLLNLFTIQAAIGIDLITWIRDQVFPEITNH